ncbi:sigma-70 family RNA polymerase sigma factor [Heyndrickxia sporothermodurans]
MDDELLSKELIAHEIDDISLIMSKYNKLLWVIIGGILNEVGTQQDIEECICDVYIKLWENPKSFNPKKGTLKAFLATIARNKAVDKYRQLTKMKAVELNEANHASNDDLLDYILNKETCEQLYKAIKSFDEPDKEIMVRRYFLAEKPAAIAKKISINVKEVENRLYQGKLKLKRLLVDQGGTV